MPIRRVGCWQFQHHLEHNSAITGRIIRLADEFGGQQQQQLRRTLPLRHSFLLLHRSTAVPLSRLVWTLFQQSWGVMKVTAKQLSVKAATNFQFSRRLSPIEWRFKLSCSPELLVARKSQSASIQDTLSLD